MNPLLLLFFPEWTEKNQDLEKYNTNKLSMEKIILTIHTFLIFTIVFLYISSLLKREKQQHLMT